MSACRHEVRSLPITTSQEGSRPIKVILPRNGHSLLLLWSRRNAMKSSLKGGHGFLPSRVNLTNPIETNQLKRLAHPVGDVAQPQVAAQAGQRLEARQDGPAATAVDELDPAQVEHQAGVALQDRGNLPFEIVGVAGVHLVQVDGD